MCAVAVLHRCRVHTAEAAQCRFAHVDHAIGRLPDAM